MGRLTTAISKRWLAALGRVTVDFQMLEHQLAQLAWLAIGNDVTVGRVITSEVRFQSLLDIVASLYAHHVHDEPRRLKMRQLLKRASDAEAERNRLLHSLWIGGPDARRRPLRVKTSAKRKKGLVFDTEATPLSRLTRLSITLEEIAFDTIDVGNDLATALGR